MDRVLSRVLSLPIFDDELYKALKSLNLDRVEKFVVLDVQTGSQFLEKIVSLFVKSNPDPVHTLIDRPLACSALIEIIHRSKSLFLKSAVDELGFAQSQSSLSGRKSSGLAKAVQSLAQDSALELVHRPSKRAKKEGDPAKILLKEQEAAQNQKWSLRLQEIGDRAGKFAKINIQEGEHVHLLSEVEKDLVKRLVLSMGSHRTLQVHVRHWERFEEWARGEGVALYPLCLDLMIKYVMFLMAKLCGPTVIPSFLTAVNFVGYRLAIEIPDTKDVKIKALVDQVIRERGKEVVEAAPFPPEVVLALECAMFEWITENPALAVFTWWVLVMICGSLRFDDACHVDPKTLQLTNEALYGVVWQTKTERKRRGTKFAVPLIGISGKPWLETGWTEFKKVEPLDRDFFIPEVDDEFSFLSEPPTYARSLFWLRFTIVKAVETAVQTKALKTRDAQLLLPYHKAVSWHSCRVTMLSLAVHEGEQEQAIGLQANWKDPGPMVLKYARNRKKVALNMVGRLIGKMREEWSPAQEVLQDAEVEVDEDSQDPEPIEFFIKDSKRSKGTLDLKFHVKEQVVGAVRTACKRLKISHLISVGSMCPDPQQLCSDCRRNRPDLLLED